MNRGILTSALYYGIGLSAACICYLTFGHGYAHAPGLHHFIILLTFGGGFLWAIGAAFKYFLGTRTNGLKGIILTNFIMSLGFVGFIAFLIDDAAKNNEFEHHEITITESGDTTTMHHGGSIVYYKVKDSVLLDFIDSAMIDWSNVKRIRK